MEWRKRISNSILLAFTVFGAVAYLPSIYLSYIQGLFNIIIFDTVVYILILFLALNKRIPISLKAVCSTALFYILGLLLLIILGPVGAGNLWLLSFSLVAGLTLGKRASVITLAINSATQLMLLLLIRLNLLDNYEVAYSMEIWLARTTNFILLNIVITIRPGKACRVPGQRNGRTSAENTEPL